MVSVSMLTKVWVGDCLRIEEFLCYRWSHARPHERYLTKNRDLRIARRTPSATMSDCPWRVRRWLPEIPLKIALEWQSEQKKEMHIFV